MDIEKNEKSTVLEQTLRELQKNQAQMQTILELIKEGVIFSDEKGYFTIYNPEMERLTGY